MESNHRNQRVKINLCNAEACDSLSKVIHIYQVLILQVQLSLLHTVIRFVSLYLLDQDGENRKPMGGKHRHSQRMRRLYTPRIIILTCAFFPLHFLCCNSCTSSVIIVHS